MVAISIGTADNAFGVQAVPAAPRRSSVGGWSPRQLGSVKRRAMMSAATEDRVRPFA